MASPQLQKAAMTFPCQPGPTTAEIERSRSFSAVVGFLWVVDRWQQPPQSTKSNVHARFRRFWVSFGCRYCHHLLPPPQLPESSIRAHFRRLLAFSSRCPYYPHQLRAAALHGRTSPSESQVIRL